MLTRKAYTVVVQGTPYDDEACTGPWLYIAKVMAIDGDDALAKGRKEAWSKQPSDQRGRLKEWRPLVCISGHPPIEWMRL